MKGFARTWRHLNEPALIGLEILCTRDNSTVFPRQATSYVCVHRHVCGCASHTCARALCGGCVWVCQPHLWPILRPSQAPNDAQVSSASPASPPILGNLSSQMADSGHSSHRS